MCYSFILEFRCFWFDLDGSGSLVIWDNFGIWDNCIDELILLLFSIKYGKLIFKISLENVGCVLQIGKWKENED